MTGEPGAGKSAVLGRIVTTADADAVQQLPAADTAVRATVGSVGCAVHAKGKTALEVATEIARAASAALPDTLEDLVPAVQDALGGQPGRRFAVVVDAVDEAATPADARDIIAAVLTPLADAGAHVVAGARPADSDGDLLGPHRGAARVVDLDDPEFYAPEDLIDYVRGLLDDGDAAAAARIAAQSDRNFLVAGLTARTRKRNDPSPGPSARLTFSQGIGIAVRELLLRVPAVAGADGGKLLTALAFAEATGFTAGLWRLAVRALGYGDVPEDQLTEFARLEAANLVDESSALAAAGEEPVFRLSHQALNDTLLDAEGGGSDDGAELLTRAFLAAGRGEGWERAPEYLLRSLPALAVRAGRVDDLLAEDAYLLRADLRRVIRVADQAVSSAGRDRARLLGLTPEAVAAAPAERAAMLGVTEALDGLGAAYRGDVGPVPYRAQWADADPRHEDLALRGHTSGVLAICAARAGGRAVLAVGDGDGALRLWNPADGSPARTLKGSGARAGAVCPVTVSARACLAAGEGNGTIRLWDLADGSRVRIMTASRSGIEAMCAMETGGRAFLASGGYDGSVYLWDLGDPAGAARVLSPPNHKPGHRAGVQAMCSINVGGQTLLATESFADRTVRLWDPVSGAAVRTLRCHQGRVRAMCAVDVGGRVLLATSCRNDSAVRLWDPADGSLAEVLEGRADAQTICQADVGGRSLLAVIGGGTITLWDPVDGSEARVLDGPPDIVEAMCAVDAGGRTRLATIGYSDNVRLWDLDAARSPAPGRHSRARISQRSQPEIPGMSRAGIHALCVVQAGERSLLATGGPDKEIELWNLDDGACLRSLIRGSSSWGRAGGAQKLSGTIDVRGRTLLVTVDGRTVGLWDPVDGSAVQVLESPRVQATCAVDVGDRTFLAAASFASEAFLRLWDPADGSVVWTRNPPRAGFEGLCAVDVAGRALLATVGGGTVGLLDPADGSPLRTMKRLEYMHTLCAVDVAGRWLLAAGSATHNTVRLWDPADGSPVCALPHQSGVNALCAVHPGGGVMLATGGNEGIVRLWNPQDGRLILAVPVHHEVYGLAAAGSSLAIGLPAGVLVIKLAV